LDNHLGSASLELDENANIISYEEYPPFGTTSYRSGRTETETSQNRYKYVGKERDEETGLYYYGFRYYAAWLCRFVSVDPLQFDYPYYTPFQYAGNMPISYIDLDGLEPAFAFDGSQNNWMMRGLGVIDDDELELLQKVEKKREKVALYGHMANLLLFAAPAIAAEAALISGTSWSSLPVVQTFNATLTAGLTSRVGAVSTDYIGQFSSNWQRSGFDFDKLGESALNVNATSITMTFMNSGSSILGLTINSMISNTYNINFEGDVKYGDAKSILIGTVFDVAGGFLGGKYKDGYIQSKINLDIQSRMKWNNTLDGVNDLHKFGWNQKYHQMYMDRKMNEAIMLDATNFVNKVVGEYSISLYFQYQKNSSAEFTKDLIDEK
jgi:RHS repeat-associated protein